MMKKKLSIGQNTLFNSVGSLVYLACQWLITVLVVRLASVEAAGNLSLAMSITNMFFTLCTFGLRDFLVSDYQGKYPMSTYFSTRLLTTLAATALCALVVLTNRHYSPLQMGCILVYMLFRVTEALIDSMQSMQQRAERMDYICRSLVLRGVGCLALFCLILRLTGSLIAAIAAMALFSLGVLLALDLPLCRRLVGLTLRFAPRQTGRLLWECAPLMCNSFCAAAIVALPRSTLEALWGEYTLGIYASIATPAVIVQTAASWIYAPTITSFTRCFAQKDREGFYRLYRLIWLIIAACVVVCLVGAKFLGRWGLGLLFEEEIVQHVDLLLPVLGTTILIACSYFLSTLLTVTRSLRVILVSNLISLALVAVLSRPIIAVWGMMGVNYVIYLAMGCNVVIMFAALTQVLHRRFRREA